MTRLTNQPHKLTRQQADTITRQNIERMQQAGDLDHAAKQLSMAYLLYTCAQTYVENATDILNQYNLVHKKVKTTANNLTQSFDAYHKVMSSMLHGDHGAQDQLCFDSTMFTDIMDAFMDHNIELHYGTYYKPTLFLPEKKLDNLPSQLSPTTPTPSDTSDHSDQSDKK